MTSWPPGAPPTGAPREPPPARVGGAAARGLVRTGRRVGAAQARRWGVVSGVVAPDALAGEVARFTAQVARAPRAKLLRTKAKIIRRAGIAAGATLDL